MSGIINKIKEAVHSDKSTTHSAPEGSHGPHNSRVANAADPRVDSDRDGSHNMTGTHRTAGHGEVGSANPFSSTTGTHGTTEGAHGPHSSRLANAADPRVDSDRDGSRTMGTGTGTGNFGTHGTTGGMGGFGTHNTHGATEGVHGPHSSRVANAVDPRVDSDRDGSRTMGSAATGTGFHSGAGSGPHSSRTANAIDPRVGGGVGAAGNTAGPHNSDMMNKMDPRVDSDLDGSKTLGGNRTFQ